MPENKTEEQFKHFLKMVKEMRDLQKKYFKERDRVTLDLSKAKEKEVDQLIKAFTFLDGQTKLFG